MSWWRTKSKDATPPNSDPSITPNFASSSLAPSSQTQRENEDSQITSLLYGFSEHSSSSTTPSGSSTSSQEHPSASLAPLPSKMSCRQAFDDAFYCQSLGGQFNNVYRYGTLRDCSHDWAQFWFCMRNRGKPEEIKSALIQEWYAKQEEKYTIGPSSCDVWEERTPAERVTGAFGRDPEADGVFGERSVLKS